MSQRYKVPITIVPLDDGSYMARCESLRATATGDTSEEAVKNLREAIAELIYEFGEAAVFQDIDINADIRIFEYAA
ncbi:MAG: type II toxin-antitoxin system HicB family antitoxin [Desulfobacteraceae bacterium]|nr:type II toxin-antitoxin system HicB family antitoxin [Desulfobacteraceae bacterium]